MSEAGFVPPAQLAKNLVNVGVSKAGLTTGKMILLGILAGIYIGFAAHLATTVATGWDIGGTAALFGLKKFFIGAVFSVGLMLVMIPGSELFTGNTLMSVALMDGKITFGGMMRNWTIVWVANLIGSVLLAYLIAVLSGANDGKVGVTAMAIANGKCGLGPTVMLVRGILANWLVCLAVMMALAAKDIAGKVFAIFFPIMAFVTSGFEHSIANMYFIPAGLFTKGLASQAGAISAFTNLSMGGAVTNILLVTLGNIIGGSICVGAVYYLIFVKGSEK